MGKKNRKKKSKKKEPLRGVPNAAPARATFGVVPEDRGNAQNEETWNKYFPRMETSVADGCKATYDFVQSFKLATLGIRMYREGDKELHDKALGYLANSVILSFSAFSEWLVQQQEKYGGQIMKDITDMISAAGKNPTSAIVGYGLMHATQNLSPEDGLQTLDYLITVLKKRKPVNLADIASLVILQSTHHMHLGSSKNAFRLLRQAADIGKKFAVGSDALYMKVCLAQSGVGDESKEQLEADLTKLYNTMHPETREYPDVCLRLAYIKGKKNDIAKCTEIRQRYEETKKRVNYIFGPYCDYWGNPEHPKGSVTEQAHGLFKVLDAGFRVDVEKAEKKNSAKYGSGSDKGNGSGELGTKTKSKKTTEKSTKDHDNNSKASAKKTMAKKIDIDKMTKIDIVPKEGHSLGHTGSILSSAFHSQFSLREKIMSRGVEFVEFTGDVYLKVRRSLTIIANHYEINNVRHFNIEDKNQTSAILMSIVGLPFYLKEKKAEKKSLNESDQLEVGLPCIFRHLKKEELNPNDPNLTTWAVQAGTGRSAQIACESEEQDLLIIHLKQNASKISDKCCKRFMKSKNYIKSYTFSFVSPLFSDPTNEKKNMEKDLCPVCNVEKAMLTCARCKVQKYCSATCQKKDWKKHKKVCRKPEASLKDGSDYIDVSLEKENPKMKGMRISNISFDANCMDLKKMMKKMKKRSGTTAINKNKKGNEMFLVKAQIIPNGDGMSMPSVVYNEDRKVQLQVGSHNTDEHGFPKLVNAVKEKGIKGIDLGFPVPWGIKGYFNAYLHKPDDGPLKGKKLLRIFLNESFPNPGW